MALTTASGGPLLRPEEVHELLVLPALGYSVAAEVLGVVHTGSTSYRIPTIDEDATASWVEEGQEIPASDATFSELDIVPPKVAALSVVSRELAEDSDPASTAAVGDSLARDLARRVDAATFGDLPSPAPAGLEAQGVTEVSGDYSNTDVFAEAVSNAEAAGAVTTAFVTDPATALAMAKVKKTSDSNEPLLSSDPTQPTRRMIAGVPLHVSPAVTSGVVWAIPNDRAFLVVRSDARIDVDHSRYFESDRVGVRGTMRAAPAFPHPAAIVKITAE